MLFSNLIKKKVKIVSKQTISEVFDEVLKNGIGVVPIENSREGPVNETLDNLFKKQVYVKYEIEKKIDIVLASNKKIKNVEEIRRIYSNYYAIQESRNVLNDLNKEIIQVESTSKAALLASKDLKGAALCSKFAANLYNLIILKNNIQDGLNITRFVVISSKISKRGKKTMLFFIVEHKPGSLYKALKEFYKRKINLTMIYSRPLKEIAWNYYFYVEIEGSLKEKRVKKALKELIKNTVDMKIKGSFIKIWFESIYTKNFYH